MSLWVGVPGRCPEGTGIGMETSVCPLLAGVVGSCVTPIYIWNWHDVGNSVSITNTYMYVRMSMHTSTHVVQIICLITPDDDECSKVSFHNICNKQESTSKEFHINFACVPVSNQALRLKKIQ